MLLYFAAFILLLGPLVFVHELGHYLFAKLFNVRVDAFSMGFGPKIFKKKWGETEYCLSAIPLGGYVKLFGQDPTELVPNELRGRALKNIEPWKRFLVFIGGPLFNFLFAVVVFAVMLVVGEPNYMPVVGRVVQDSQAYVAGFRSGDHVVMINKQSIAQLDEVSRQISESPNKELQFRVKRQNAFHEVKVVPRPIPGHNLYGEAAEVGTIDGFQALPRAAVIAVTNPKSTAALMGLKTGDQILTLNGKNVKNFEDLEERVGAAIKSGAKEIVVGVAQHTLKGQPEKPISELLNDHNFGLSQKVTLEARFPAKPLESLGLFSSELIVASVIKGSPAEKGGLISGDRLISAGETSLRAFSQLRERVQSSGEAGESFVLTFEREGKVLHKTINPVENVANDSPLPKAGKQFMMGIYPLAVNAEPEIFHSRILNPFTLTVESWSRSIDLSAKTLISIKKLLFRQVSVGTLGGPLLIGKLAGDSMLRGVSQFLKVMAMISISLAIFNILPVPVLDGGHIFLLLIEVVRGRPISIRQTEVVQQVGLSLIVLLLVVVLFNDFSRVGIPALKSIFQ